MNTVPLLSMPCDDMEELRQILKIEKRSLHLDPNNEAPLLWKSTFYLSEHHSLEITDTTREQNPG